MFDTRSFLYCFYFMWCSLSLRLDMAKSIIPTLQELLQGFHLTWSFRCRSPTTQQKPKEAGFLFWTFKGLHFLSLRILGFVGHVFLVMRYMLF
jgi:hypothetical protein